MTSLRIVVTGLIAQHPSLGGLTWHYLQYAAGLMQLGHDVYYVEDSGEWPYNLDGGPGGNDWIARDCTPNLRYLAGVMDRFGLGGKWAYRFPTDDAWFGLSDSAREGLIRSADLLVNVSGSLMHPERFGAIPRRAYIDTDPVFTQIKLALEQPGFRPRVEAHDTHFTFGERLTERTPEGGYRWRPTRMPIVLREWDEPSDHRDAFTTVMNWTSYPPLVYEGQSYGQKDVEFVRFLELPTRVRGGALEVALNHMHRADWATATVEKPSVMAATEHSTWTVGDLLAHAGWRVESSTEVCGDMDSYRRYIRSSKGEWSIAKNGYVVGQPGWFSDRSACYLAAGRPVVVQDTGFADVFPLGEGLLAFRTLDEAAAALKDVEADYDRHAKAARSIAHEYFDSDRVLASLVSEAMG